jgi:hypothetical protein
MRLNNGTDWLELEAAPPPPGFHGAAIEPDVLLNVSFQVASFHGTDQSWVERSDWDGFLQEFTALEASRTGEAVLPGASPDEFELRFYVYDSLGHPAVKGILGRRSGHDRTEFGSRVEFCMPFEADQIALALNAFRSYSKEPK